MRLHRPFFPGRRGPRGRKASLKIFMDSASLAERLFRLRRPGVRETVAPEYSVSGPRGLNDCRKGGRIHGGMDRGAAAREKNGATTS